MESLLVNAEVIAVTALAFLLALVVQPLLVMAVLGIAKRAAEYRPPKPACEPRLAELRALATGPKDLSRG